MISSHDNTLSPMSVSAQLSQKTSLSSTAKRQDEDYDEQVEESLQDEVIIFPPVKDLERLWKPAIV